MAAASLERPRTEERVELPDSCGKCALATCSRKCPPAIPSSSAAAKKLPNMCAKVAELLMKASFDRYSVATLWPIWAKSWPSPVEIDQRLATLRPKLAESLQAFWARIGQHVGQACQSSSNFGRCLTPGTLLAQLFGNFETNSELAGIAGGNSSVRMASSSSVTFE